MNEILFFIGRPGFGKSTLAELYKKNAASGFIFHMGKLLRKPESFLAYITSGECEYLKNLRSAIEDTIAYGRLCTSGDIDAIAIKTILGLAKDYDLFLDGYPRNLEQAKLLRAECARAGIRLRGINVEFDADDSLQDMLSFHRQYQREQINQEKDPYDTVSRYYGKLKTFHSETIPALRYLQESDVPVRTVYVGHHDTIRDTKQIPFHSIVNPVSGESFYGNEFYFYPTNVAEYAACYRNYSTDKFPVMVTITLSNTCTDNCIGCFNAAFNTGEYIDIEVLEKLVDELADHGTVAVKVAGREPTAYPYLGRFLKKCRERNLLSVVITSGANLDKWEHDLYEYCDHLRVSLNAYYPESHLRFHRPSPDAIPFEQRLEILRRIAPERRRRGLTTGVSFLIRDHNEQELPLLIEYCKEIGIDYLRFSEINYFNKDGTSMEDFIGQMEALSTDRLSVRYHNQFVSDSRTVPSAQFACPAILSRSVILANGDVISCHGYGQLAKCGHESVYGNINEASFTELWRGEKRAAFIEAVSQELSENFRRSGQYVCGESQHCAVCKYSGFNHINRWIAGQGTDVLEDYWGGILYDD